jgi:hypothetical protein
MTGSAVRINAFDVMLHRCVASMIVRIYGSKVPHRISGGELSLMERVVVGHERFAWGLALHSQMVTQLDRCRSAGQGEFTFGSILVAFFLERVPALWPRVVLEVPAMRHPHLRQWSDILVHHDGGEGEPLLHGGGCIDMAADAPGHTPVLVCGGGLSGMTLIWYCLLGRLLMKEVCDLFLFLWFIVCC